MFRTNNAPSGSTSSGTSTAMASTSTGKGKSGVKGKGDAKAATEVAVAAPGSWILDVYAARCKDTGAPSSPQEAKSFMDHMLPYIKGPVVTLRGQLLGVFSGIVLSKVLRSVVLTKLDIYGNVVRDQGVQALCQLLLDNPNIRSINLGCNDITDKGGRFLAEMLEKNQSLWTLRLGIEAEHFHDNSLTSVSGEALAKALAVNHSLTALVLTGNAITSGGSVSEGSGAVPALIELLSVNTTVQTLDLGSCSLGSRTGERLAATLASNSTLTHLYLSKNGLGPETGRTLGAFLATNTTLAILDVSENPLDLDGGLALVSSLASNTGLIALNVANVGLARLAVGTPFLPGDAKVPNQSYVKSIQDGAFALARSLAVNTTLTDLNVGYNHIDCDGAMAIAEALRENEVLATITLSGNKVYDEAARVLGSVLDRNTALGALYLNSARIGDAGALCIADAAASKGLVATLSLHDNFISEAGGATLCDIISVSETLVRVVLTGNQVNHNTILKVNEICSRNLSAQKMARTVPLKAEIVRLVGQQQKLQVAEKRLKALQDERSRYQVRIGATEEQMEVLHDEHESITKKLKHDIEVEEASLVDVKRLLADKINEIDSVNDEYKNKIEEEQARLEEEVKKREAMTEAVEAADREYVEREAAIAERVDNLRKEIEQTRINRDRCAEEAKAKKEEFRLLEAEAKRKAEEEAEQEAARLAAAKAAAPPKKKKTKKSGKAPLKASGSGGLASEVDALMA